MKGRNTAYLYLLSVASTALLVWSIFVSVRQPNIGAFWEYSTGIIYQIDASHPSAAQLNRGDRVISGDGHPANEVYQYISGRAGQSITLVVDQNGTSRQVAMRLLEPDPNVIASRLIPLLIAFAFGLSGNIVYAFSRVSKQNILFFLFCQTLEITLSAGAVSSFTSDWIKTLFQLGMILSGVFVIHLHTIFPSGVTFRHKTHLLNSSSSIACLLSLLLLLERFFGFLTAQEHMLAMACLLFIGVSFMVVFYLWSKSFFHSSSGNERKQAGILAFFGILGFFPLIVFSVIPHLLMGVTWLPYDISLSSLVFIPVGYSYAIYRYKIGIDRTMHRGATFALVIMVMAALYMISFSLEQKFIGSLTHLHPIWEMATTLLLAVVYRQIYHSLTIFTEKLLYGGWYDYRSILQDVSASLKVTGPDHKTIAYTICQTLGRSMQLEYAALFLYDGEFIFYEAGKTVQASQQSPQVLDALYQTIETHGSELNEENREEIRQILSQFGIKTNLSDKVQYLVPLSGNQHNLGIFVLGNKLGRGIFSAGDQEILDSVMQQARIGIENARLINEMQEHATILRKMHQKMGQTREDEQKRIARDLHDIVIQALVGLRYQLAGMRPAEKTSENMEWENTRKEIQRIIGISRQLCTDLRPASLDMEGLIPTIKGRIKEINQKASFLIDLEVIGDESQAIPDDKANALYRFFNEAIINVQKHSRADYVGVQIELQPAALRMTIQDNGQGFQVPKRLDDLGRDQHFGLIGLREHIEMVDGSVQISSCIGEGSVVSACIPLMV